MFLLLLYLPRLASESFGVALDGILGGNILYYSSLLHILATPV